MSLRVAFVVPTLDARKGWGSLSVGVMRALQPHVDPILVLPDDELPDAARLFPGVPTVPLPSTQTIRLASPREWMPAVQSWQRVTWGSIPTADLVHSLEVYATGLAGHWLARRMKAPHVLTACGTYAGLPGHPLDRWGYGRLMRGASIVCPISDATAHVVERACRDVGVSVEIAVIRPGTNLKSTGTPDPEVRTDVPRPVLISVGAVKRRKGYHTSLAAFGLVKQQFPQAQYWIVGDTAASPSYLRELEAQIEREGIRGVAFLGLLDDETLAARLRDASVFVLTPVRDGQNFEGFGLVYLEAAACGLPIVASQSGGTTEAFDPGVNGIACDTDDVAGIARAIARLFEDETLRRTMGEAGRAFAKSMSWERFAFQQLDVYRQALSAGADTRPGEDGPGLRAG